MRNRCFSQKGGRQGPNRTASERALVSCVKMWYTNGPLQNIALLSPFKLTVTNIHISVGYRDLDLARSANCWEPANFLNCKGNWENGKLIAPQNDRTFISRPSSLHSYIHTTPPSLCGHYIYCLQGSSVWWLVSVLVYSQKQILKIKYY